jgi:hypothetical protein
LKTNFTTYTDTNGITIKVYKPRKIGKNQKTFQPAGKVSSSVYNRIVSLPTLNIQKGLK